MDDPTSIPFEFEDCDAFLASLDDNNTSLQSQPQFQQACYPTMSEYTNTNSATLTGAGPDVWSLAQPDQYSQQQPTSNGATSQNPTYMMNPVNLEPSNFMVQPNSFYNSGAESSNSSPLSSPSMSINSVSDSDTTGGFLTGSVMYPSTNNNAPIANPHNTMAYSNNAPLDNSYNAVSSYPITPPYPSAATDSSSGEPGTSPEEDYAYNDISYQAFGLEDASIPISEESSSPTNGFVKQEPISPSHANNQGDDKSDLKNKGAKAPQVKKLPAQKLNTESKSNKITKPKKEKTSHNMIEKRYRTNINDKILALRDCVPSLRCVVTGVPRPSEDLEGLTPASKLNKATVLTKATEYILHLQKRNAMLLKELSESRHGRPIDMQLLADMGGLPPNAMPAYPQGHPGMPPQNNNNYASKAMMLSMAGIMGAGLMNDGSDMHGLSAIPLFSFTSSAHIGPWGVQSLLYAFKFALILGTVLYLVAPSLFDTPSSKDSKVQGDQYSFTDDLPNEYSLCEMRRQTWLTNTRSLDIPSETISSQLVAFFKNIAQVFIINLMGTDGYKMIAGVLDKEQLSVKCDCLSRAIDAQLCGGDERNTTRARLFYTFIKSFVLPPTPSRFLTQSIHVSVLCHGVYILDSAGSYLSKYFWNKARAGAQDSSEEFEDDDNVVPKNVRALLDVFQESPETIQRLYNIAYGLPVSDCCMTGEDDEGYLSVITDKSIRSIADVLAALYANSLLHEILANVLESDEIDFHSLELCSKIAPPRSIVARRVAIAEALLMGPKDAIYAKNAMDMLKEELDQQAWISHEFVSNLDSTSNSICNSSVGARSRSNSHATPATQVLRYQNYDSILENAVENSDEEDDITVSSRSSSIMSDDSLLSRSDSESVTTERGEDVVFLSSAVKTSSSPFVVSQDSRLGIRCSLILCYLSRNVTDPAYQLLQKVEINKLENIGLLGFVALWKVLKEMHERKHSANRHKLEDLSAVARVWLGGNTGTREGISLVRLRELVGESVQMSKYFGGYECELDEGYGTQ